MIIYPYDFNSNLSITKTNSVKFTRNDPVAKISYTKFAVFGPVKRENLFNAFAVIHSRIDAFFMFKLFKRQPHKMVKHTQLIRRQ